MNDTVSGGLRSAIELNGLSHRLFAKYNDFIQAQINLATKEKPTLVPKSQIKRQNMPCPLEEFDMTETIEKLGAESGKRMMTTSNLGVLIRRHSSVALSDGSFLSPLDRSIQGQQKHHDPETNRYTPTLYYAVPGTENLHLLSFAEGRFISHELATRIPMRSSTT